MVSKSFAATLSSLTVLASTLSAAGSGLKRVCAGVWLGGASLFGSVGGGHGARHAGIREHVIGRRELLEPETRLPPRVSQRVVRREHHQNLHGIPPLRPPAHHCSARFFALAIIRRY